MDNRHRVYYLVNLNQNRKLGGWWHKGWDNCGIRYYDNLRKLKQSITSLKERYRPYDYHSTENYHVMISCKKEEESALIKILRKSRDVNYIKIDPTNKEKYMANAKKCDRCGVFYEKNILYSKKIRNSVTHVDGVCMTTATSDHVDYMDLCDDCICKLGLFLSGIELKEV